MNLEQKFPCLMGLSLAGKRNYAGHILGNILLCSKFEAGVTGSIILFCRGLSVHCEKEVIFLLDEYDVPLDKAYQNGYYEEMVTTL